MASVMYHNKEKSARILYDIHFLIWQLILDNVATDEEEIGGSRNLVL